MLCLTTPHQGRMMNIIMVLTVEAGMPDYRVCSIIGVIDISISQISTIKQVGYVEG